MRVYGLPVYLDYMPECLSPARFWRFGLNDNREHAGVHVCTRWRYFQGVLELVMYLLICVLGQSVLTWYQHK